MKYIYHVCEQNVMNVIILIPALFHYCLVRMEITQKLGLRNLGRAPDAILQPQDMRNARLYPTGG